MRYPRRLARIVAATTVCLSVSLSGYAQRARASEVTYVVQPNDTLSSIAQAYGTTVEALLAQNNLPDPNHIETGQLLVIGAALVAARAYSAIYTVQPGDTLSAIGLRLGIPLEALAAANGLSAPYTIREGQQLVVPGSGGGAGTATAVTAGANSYTVQRGDTLSAIGLRLGVSLEALAAANGLSAPYTIREGQQLVVPGGATNGVASPATAGTYIVRAGDTLSGLSQRFGVSINALAAVNNMTVQSGLLIGQQLAIPTGGSDQPAGAVAPAGIEAMLAAQALAAGVDVALVKALAWQESGWQMVVAADGGIGVMQLMPDTVAWESQYLLGYQIDPYDPTDNIRAGVALLRYCLQTFGSVREALAAYHQGITSVQQDGISADTEQYINDILALQQQFAA